MSDLTRFNIYQRYTPQKSLTGEWVKAEEAEARIKMLTEDRAELWQEVKALRLQVRAADELADAVERYGKRFTHSGWMKAWNACLAYREAGK
jgi:hypothetical protein